MQRMPWLSTRDRDNLVDIFMTGHCSDTEGVQRLIGYQYVQRTRESIHPLGVTPAGMKKALSIKLERQAGATV